MSDAFQFQSRVGDDGVLNLHLDLGRREASKEVVVTVQPLDAPKAEIAPTLESGRDFVARTYGSCADTDLERHPQGEYEIRESFE